MFTDDDIPLVLGLLDVELRKALNSSVHKIATTDAINSLNHAEVNLRSLKDEVIQRDQV